MHLSVTVILPNDHVFATTPQEMAGRAKGVFPVEDRVPGALGEGFDLLEWYESLSSLTPTHLIVRAADEFQATIPWDQLEGALFQYAIGGEPLTKGRPIRLYVPDGTSACLNVKSVVYVRIANDKSLGEEATYGFMNEVSPDQLTKRLKSR